MDDLVQAFTCPECGAAIEYLQMECLGCGCSLDWGEQTRLEVADGDYVVCTTCHREILRTAKFCPECGALQMHDGFVDYTSERVLPKCPQCGEEVDYGATRCDACGAELQWETAAQMLVDLSAFAEREVLPRQNRPRYQTNYKRCSVQFNTFDHELKTKGRRLDTPKRYSPPKVHYNSFGVYSE